MTKDIIKNFTEADVAEQEKHQFTKFFHDFSSNPKATVDFLALYPACMAANESTRQKKPSPGVFLVAFTPVSCTSAQENAADSLVTRLGMANAGTLRADQPIFMPPDGIITHKLVQDVLATLHRVGTITQEHVAEAAKTFGIPAPDLSKQAEPVVPERPVTLPQDSTLGVKPQA